MEYHLWPANQYWQRFSPSTVNQLFDELSSFLTVAQKDSEECTAVGSFHTCHLIATHQSDGRRRPYSFSIDAPCKAYSAVASCHEPGRPTSLRKDTNDATIFATFSSSTLQGIHVSVRKMHREEEWGADSLAEARSECNMTLDLIKSIDVRTIQREQRMLHLAQSLADSLTGECSKCTWHHS